MQRPVKGDITHVVADYSGAYATGALTSALVASGLFTGGGSHSYIKIAIDLARVVPTGAANKPRAWGALACAYLGTPAS